MKRFTFVPEDVDYEPGDDRCYRVLDRGYVIGVVERDYVPSAIPDGEPVRGWAFCSDDNTHRGLARTRLAAVRDAYDQEHV